MKRRSWLIDVWEEPKDKHDYIIGGDPAGGMASSTYSAAHVLRDDMTVVAVLHGKIDPDEYEKAVEALGYTYNEALICIERNRDGQGINAHLMNRNYPNLYFGKEFKIRGEMTDLRPGIYAGRTNRRKIINTIADVVKNDLINIFHKKTLDEMRTFVKDEDGEGKAMQGMYDDLVFSLAYAVVALSEQGFNRDALQHKTKKSKKENQREEQYNRAPHTRAVKEDGSSFMWPE